MGEYDYGSINNNPTYAFNSNLAYLNSLAPTQQQLYGGSGFGSLTNQYSAAGADYSRAGMTGNVFGSVGGGGGGGYPSGDVQRGPDLPNLSGPFDYGGGGGNVFQTGAPAYNDYSIPNFGAGAQPNYGGNINWQSLGVDSQGGSGPSPFWPSNMPIQTQPIDNSWTIDSYGNPVPRGYGNTGMDLYGRGPYAPSQPPPFGGQSPINGVPAAGTIGPYMDPFTSYPWNGNPAANVDYRFPQFDWSTQNYMNQLNQGLNNTGGSANTLIPSDYQFVGTSPGS